MGKHQRHSSGGRMQFLVMGWVSAAPGVPSAATLIEQTHLLLSTAGRLVLTIAAILYLAYVLLITAALVSSLIRGWIRSIRGWIRSVLHSSKRFAIAPERHTIHVMVKQS